MDPSQIDPNQNIVPYEQIAEMRKRAKLAAALRGQAEQTMQRKDQPIVSITQGNDNFPGQVDRNNAGIYANLTRDLVGAGLNAWGSHKEQQSEDDRLAVMQDLSSQIGQVGADGKPAQMTAQQAMALSDLGIHPSIVKEAMQDDSYNVMKNLHSYAKNPAAIRALVSMGQLDPEIGDQMMKDLAEQDVIEHENKLSEMEYQASLRPQRQNEMSELEFYQQDPEGYQKYKQASRGPGSAARMELENWIADNPDKPIDDFYKLKASKGYGAPALDATDKKRFGEVREGLDAAQQKYSNSQYILDEIEKNPQAYFGNKATMSNIMSNYAKTHEGALGQVLNAFARGTATPEMLAIDSKIMRSVLEDMKMLGGNDSNQELETILKSYIDSRNDPQAAMKFMEETSRLAEEGVIAHEKELEELTETVDGRPKRYSKEGTLNYKRYAHEERARRKTARDAEKAKARGAQPAPGAPTQTAPAPAGGGWKVVR